MFDIRLKEVDFNEWQHRQTSPNASKLRSNTAGKPNMDFIAEIGALKPTTGDKGRFKHDLKRYSAARAIRSSFGGASGQAS
jgi:hypothetical protein